MLKVYDSLFIGFVPKVSATQLEGGVMETRQWHRVALLSVVLVFALSLAAPAQSAAEGLTAAPLIENKAEGGDWEDCPHRLIISVDGAVPESLVISGWTAFDSGEFDVPTGAKEFDIPWVGKPFDVGFAEGTSYRIWGWTDRGGWIPLFDFQSDQCGDHHRSYTFASPVTIVTPTMVCTPMPTATPQPQLPETGGGGGWLLWPVGLAVLVLAFAILRWRSLHSAQ